MPRGSNPKREQEYATPKHAFTKDHCYPGSEEEVAARIVNKQRKQAGETSDARARRGRRDPPLDDVRLGDAGGRVAPAGRRGDAAGITRGEVYSSR